MGFDQKGPLVFQVAKGKAGVWNVMEEGFDEPLASFDTSEDARDYAIDIAKSKDGSTVKIFDEHGKQIVHENEIG